MTKKELTTLLILFCGGWLLVLSLIATLNALPAAASLIAADPHHREFPSLLITGAALLPILCYGSLAFGLIRWSHALASRLLRWGGIDGTTVISGGAVTGLTPLLFSLLGLYFLVENLPYFLLTAFRWFTLEASTHASTRILGSDSGMQIAAYKSELVQYGLTIALALLVLLRSAWIASLVQKFSQGPVRTNITAGPTPSA